jgi:hypothetical protein
MDPLSEILIGATLAFLLHELTHLLVIYHYKIRIKAIVFTKWSVFGFLVDNKSYIDNNRKLVFLHISPLIWCTLIFVAPHQPFFLMFLLVNLFGGIGDIYSFFKIIIISPEERVEWTTKNEEKILKSIIWRKNIGRKTS